MRTYSGARRRDASPSRSSSARRQRMATGPLRGVKVLDFTQYQNGPREAELSFCCVQLCRPRAGPTSSRPAGGRPAPASSIVSWLNWRLTPDCCATAQRPRPCCLTTVLMSSRSSELQVVILAAP